MMIIAALAVFTFTTWAVFSNRFRDGILAKQFLSLSAITAFIVVIDNQNYRAALASGMLLICGLSLAWYKHRHRVLVPRRQMARGR